MVLLHFVLNKKLFGDICILGLFFYVGEKSVRSVGNIIWVGDQDKEGRIIARNYYSLTTNN